MPITGVELRDVDGAGAEHPDRCCCVALPAIHTIMLTESYHVGQAVRLLTCGRPLIKTSGLSLYWGIIT